VSIVLIGKYTSLQDSYMSVVKALEHASMRCGHKLDLQVSAGIANMLNISDNPVGRLFRPRAGNVDARSRTIPRCLEGSLFRQVSPYGQPPKL
jgi:hypothetical protein